MTEKEPTSKELKVNQEKEKKKNILPGHRNIQTCCS